MKNKIFKLLIFFLPVLMLQSCLSDQDDVFDESPSLRVQQTLTKTKAILCNSEHGWLMDYTIGDDGMYGSYAYIVKFDSITCTAYSEFADESATSHYKLTTDNGPVLTFDTYNSVMHELSTPSQENYEGFHADFEFLILSANDSLVVLKAKKTGNIINMTKLKETPKSYLENQAAMQENFIIESADGQVGGKDVIFVFDIDNRQVEATSKTDSTLSYSSPFVVTDKGIRFNTPFESNGISIKDFVYNESNSTMSDVNNSSIVLQTHMPVGYVKYKEFEGNYSFGYKLSNGSSFVPTSIDVKLTPNDDGSSYTMSGMSDMFTIQLNYNKSKGSLEMNSQVIGISGDNQVWLCAWGIGSGGNLTWANEAGMMTQLSSLSTDENLVFDWVTNEYEGLTTDSFIMWLIKPDGSSAGQFQNSQWAVQGSNRICYLTSLVKK